ncbi:MAG: hypothetical protein ACXV0U_01800 [Kineosporiaceae bacterium]
MDGAWVRQRAAEVAGLADEVRAIAEGVRRAGDVEWRSAAAASFRQGLDAEVRRLLAVAGEVDEGAVALRAHAAAIEALGPVPLVGALLHRALP